MRRKKHKSIYKVVKIEKSLNHIRVTKEDSYDVDFIICNKNDAQILFTGNDKNVHSVVITEKADLEKIANFFSFASLLKDEEYTHIPTDKIRKRIGQLWKEINLSDPSQSNDEGLKNIEREAIIKELKKFIK